MGKNGFFQNHLRNLSFVTKKKNQLRNMRFRTKIKKKEGKDRHGHKKKNNNKNVFKIFENQKSKKLSKNTLIPENNSVSKNVAINCVL